MTPTDSDVQLAFEAWLCLQVMPPDHRLSEVELLAEILMMPPLERQAFKGAVQQIRRQIEWLQSQTESLQSTIELLQST